MHPVTPPVLLLDVDRTLLDTSAWCRLVARTLYPDSADAALSAFTRSGTGHGLTHTFDLDAAAAALGCAAADLIARIDAEVDGRACCYPDTGPLLAAVAREHVEAALCTFGDRRWQAVKLRSCGLNQLPAHIVGEPKRYAIARTYPGRTGWLVDDKPGQHLPDGWTEILLDRHGNHRTRSAGRRITGLADVPAATWRTRRIARPAAAAPARTAFGW